MDKLLELGRQVKKMDYIAAWTWSQTVGFIEGFVKGYKAQLNLQGLTDDCVLPKTIGKLYELGFEETCVRSVLDITHTSGRNSLKDMLLTSNTKTNSKINCIGKLGKIWSSLKKSTLVILTNLLES